MIEDFNKKLNDNGEVESARQFMAIINSVFHEKKHKSRAKMLKLLKK